MTVSVTSVSPTPIRGTMALQTYWPASAWLTDFKYSWLLLLRTCGGVNRNYKQGKSAAQQEAINKIKAHMDKSLK